MSLKASLIETNCNELPTNAVKPSKDSNEEISVNIIKTKKDPPSSSITINDKNDVDAVKTFAYAVCREYLSGAWKLIDIGDFKIERVS
jgi:hypothetical protein